MVEKKLFLQIQRINIVYPSVGNMMVVPITKRTEIIMCTHVCLISRMNTDYKENGGKKAFPANPKHQILYPNVKNMIAMPITKRMKIIIGVQVYLISRMNYDYKENGGKKAFPANSKHQYRVSPYG